MALQNAANHTADNMAFHPTGLQYPVTVVRNSNFKVSGSGTGYIMQQTVQLRWRLHTKLESCNVKESSIIFYVQIQIH